MEINVSADGHDRVKEFKNLETLKYERWYDDGHKSYRIKSDHYAESAGSLYRIIFLEDGSSKIMGCGVIGRQVSNDTLRFLYSSGRMGKMPPQKSDAEWLREFNSLPKGGVK